MAMPMVSSAKGVTFGGSKRRVASFRVAGVNTFASFPEDELHFWWQAQHFGDLHRHFAWHIRSTSDVPCGVFLRIELSGLRQVVTTCKFRGRRGIL